MKSTFYNLIIFTALFSLSLSCENDDVDVPEEPTAQELILGTWQIDSAKSDIYVWKFDKNEATVKFTEDSLMLFTNNTQETIIPSIDQKYYIDKLCDLNEDKNCTDEQRLEVLITISIAKRFNTIKFEKDNRKLIFGQRYVDGVDYYCSRTSQSTK